MNTTQDDDKLNTARMQYAQEWGIGNANWLRANGNYQWMADHLKGCKRVLEVGIGSGRSTEALLTLGCKVLGIDENPACIDLAEKYLRGAGFTVTSLLRGKVRFVGSGYEVDYSANLDSRMLKVMQAYLVEGDMLTDPKLKNWIGDQAEIDAISCWLMGTYYERVENTGLGEFPLKSPADYRSHVVLKTIELANQVLTTSQILHIVDRGVPPASAEKRDQYKAYYTLLVENSEFYLDNLDFQTFLEPNDGSGVGLTKSVKREDLSGQKIAFISAIYRKN